MKKNKLLYIITILIALFTFNMNVNAVNAYDNNSTITLTCVYKKPENDNKVAFQQDSQGNIYVYINESNVSVTQPGWNPIDILAPEYMEGVDRTNNGLNTCPESITFETKTFQNCTSNAMNQQCITTNKNIITFYGNESGEQKLEVSLGAVNMGAEEGTYDEPAPGIRNPELERIETFTTGKKCEVAIADCQNNESCKHNENHLATCYYGEDIEDEGCHIISISFPTEDEIEVKAIDPSYTSTVYYAVAGAGFSRVRQAVIDNDGWCLGRIRVRRIPDGQYTRTYISELGIRDNDYEHYYRISEAGYNIIDQTKLQSENPDKNMLSGNLNVTRFIDCASIFNDESSKKLLDLIKFVINIIKIVIPILLIGLGTFDFVKAIFGSKEDEMKKAQDKFIKRIIIGVCLFLVPTILKLILTIGNSVWGDVISADFCGIL